MKIRLVKSMVIFFPYSLLAGCCVFGSRREEVIFSKMHSIQSEAMSSDEEMVKGCLSIKRDSVVKCNLVLHCFLKMQL